MLGRYVGITALGVAVLLVGMTTFAAAHAKTRKAPTELVSLTQAAEPQSEQAYRMTIEDVGFDDILWLQGAFTEGNSSSANGFASVTCTSDDGTVSCTCSYKCCKWNGTCKCDKDCP